MAVTLYLDVAYSCTFSSLEARLSNKGELTLWRFIDIFCALRLREPCHASPCWISLYIIDSWIFHICQVLNGMIFPLTNSEESAPLVLQQGPLDCLVHKSRGVDARGLTTNFHLSCQVLLSVYAIVVIMFVGQCKDTRLFVTCDKFILVTFLNEAADN